jgi:hypothetical protein
MFRYSCSDDVLHRNISRVVNISRNYCSQYVLLSNEYDPRYMSLEVRICSESIIPEVCS